MPRPQRGSQPNRDDMRRGTTPIIFFRSASRLLLPPYFIHLFLPSLGRYQYRAAVTAEAVLHPPASLTRPVKNLPTTRATKQTTKTIRRKLRQKQKHKNKTKKCLPVETTDSLETRGAEGLSRSELQRARESRAEEVLHGDDNVSERWGRPGRSSRRTTFL